MSKVLQIRFTQNQSPEMLMNLYIDIPKAFSPHIGTGIDQNRTKTVKKSVEFCINHAKTVENRPQFVTTKHLVPSARWSSLPTEAQTINGSNPIELLLCIHIKCALLEKSERLPQTQGYTTPK
jgi:hypothetical protein